MFTTLDEITVALCGEGGTHGILPFSGYEDGITDRINRAVDHIAAGVRLPDGSITPPLPDLYKMATVATVAAQPYASLPTDYQRGLFLVSDTLGDAICPPRGGNYYAFNLFLKQARRKDLTQTGTVDSVCVKGTRLYYQDIPTVGTLLTCHYYRKPTPMATSSSAPDGIPSHLQLRVIQHYVAKEVFGEVEDGMDGAKPNYMFHAGRFYDAMIDLMDFVGIDATPEYFAGGDHGSDW